MITEKQKRTIKELCHYVNKVCGVNSLGVFMVVVASEEHPTSLEQYSGTILLGEHAHVVNALSELIIKHPEIRENIYDAAMLAREKEDGTSGILSWEINMN